MTNYQWVLKFEAGTITVQIEAENPERLGVAVYTASDEITELIYMGEFLRRLRLQTGMYGHGFSADNPRPNDMSWALANLRIRTAKGRNAFEFVESPDLGPPPDRDPQAL
jgi:hypothetical protein